MFLSNGSYRTMGEFMFLEDSALVDRFFCLYYSHSHKTENTRENLWNVYCFETNQKRDETAKDNRQAPACISHDLIQNN